MFVSKWPFLKSLVIGRKEILVWRDKLNLLHILQGRKGMI